MGVGQSESSHSLAAKKIPDGWNGLLMVSCTPINVLYMWVIMSHTVILFYSPSSPSTEIRVQQQPLSCMPSYYYPHEY